MRKSHKPRVKVEDTGIYRKKTISVPIAPQNRALIMQALTDAVNEVDNLESYLAQSLSAAERIIPGPHADAEDCEFNGPIVDDACELRFRHFRLRDAMAAGDVRAVAWHAIRIGRYEERIGVREAEPDARRGKFVRNGGQKGGRANARANAVNPADVKAFVTSALRDKAPADAYRLAAKHFGRSPRQIMRLTKDLRPPKKLSAKSKKIQ